MRVSSVDAVRGLVIMIMALDHTRDYFHSAAMVFPPEDLSRTWTALFLTRWITHICAPAFALLAGVSAWLWQSRDRTAGQLSAFLVKRGLMLVLLDLIVMRFAMFFSMTSSPVILSVLWSLGWAMVFLAALIHLPRWVLAPVSVAVIVLHNALDGVAAASFGGWAWLWQVLHQQGVFVAGGIPVFVAYPLVPWFAVMGLGYCLGPMLMADRPDRGRRLVYAGLALTAGFVLLRWANVYGDPRPWSGDVAPVLSFLNTTKYPPSLAFLLMTLGPALVLLGVFDRVRLASWNPLVVFGRVPLFFFVAHFFLIHVLTFPVAQLWYGDSSFLWQPLPSMGGRAEAFPPNFGYPLWFTYAIWLLVLVLMYVPCRWVRERGKRPVAAGMTTRPQSAV